MAGDAVRAPTLEERVRRLEEVEEDVVDKAAEKLHQAALLISEALTILHPTKR